MPRARIGGPARFRQLAGFGPLAALLAACLAQPTPASATPSGGSFIYAIDQNTKQLLEFNPNTNTATVIRDLDNLVSGADGNALAYDTASTRLWFFDSSYNLRYYDRGASTTPVVATASDVGTLLGLGSGSILQFANASFFDGDYWFVYPGTTASPTARLARLQFDNAGGPNPTLNVATSRTYTLTYDATGSGLNLNLRTFGDIAIDAVGQKLYGATARVNLDGSPVASSTRSAVFSIDLAARDSASSLSVDTLNVLSGTAPASLQLSWDSTFQNLYGVANLVVSDNGTAVSTQATGVWYQINPANGSLTTLPQYSTASITINDLAGAAATADPNVDPDPVPAPLPIFGAAAAFGWSRRLRHRLRV